MHRAAAVMVFDKNRAEKKDPSESISFVCFIAGFAGSSLLFYYDFYALLQK